MKAVGKMTQQRRTMKSVNIKSFYLDASVGDFFYLINYRFLNNNSYHLLPLSGSR